MLINKNTARGASKLAAVCESLLLSKCPATTTRWFVWSFHRCLFAESAGLFPRSFDFWEYFNTTMSTSSSNLNYPFLNFFAIVFERKQNRSGVELKLLQLPYLGHNENFFDKNTIPNNGMIRRAILDCQGVRWHCTDYVTLSSTIVRKLYMAIA